MTMFLFQYCYPYLAKRYPVKVPVRYHIRLKLYPNVSILASLQPLAAEHHHKCHHTIYAQISATQTGQKFSEFA